MKSLVLHIEYLLHRHDCVILPGLGAFVVEYASASIDYTNGRILPPTRTIGFNEAIRHDDGLLANSIARAEQVKFEEAQIILHHHLSELKGALQRDNCIRLGKLGSLVVSEDSILRFTSRLSASQTFTSIGTPSIEYGTQQPRESNCTLSQPIVGDASPEALTADEATLPPDSYVKVLSKKNYYIPINKIFARCAASLIVIAAIALSFIVPQPAGNNQEIKASLNPAETLASKPSDARRIETPQPESIADPEREDGIAELAEATPSIVDSPSGYYLIVGTFPNKSEAELFMSQRNGGEFPLQAVERNGLYRIAAGHGDYQTLRAILNSTEFRAAFSEAWIWNADKN